MGLLRLLKPLQGWAVFCLHRTIYTLGVCLIKATAAGCGQLLICTSDLLWQASLWVASNRSATPWTNENLLDCSFTNRLMASCAGEGHLERKACLESAKTEAERIACNNAAAIRLIRKGIEHGGCVKHLCGTSENVFSGFGAVERCQAGCKFLTDSGLRQDIKEILPTPDQC